MSDDLYNDDYPSWVEQQHSLLASGEVDKIDVKNWLREIEDMGDTKLDVIESHLIVLLTHLLKYHYQTYVLNPDLPEPKEFRSWYISMASARASINRIVKKYRFMEKRISSILTGAYSVAVNSAVKEMNYYVLNENKKLTDSTFPLTCPWDLENIMEEDWLP